MSQTEGRRYQAIVIGAGISGLSSAKWLHENGVNVLVLEARDRVGGRTFTKRDPKIKYVDHGGAYLGVTQYHLIRMIKELGIESYKINEEEDLVYYHESGCRKLFAKNTMPKFWNPFTNMDMNNFFRSLDELGKEIPVEAPWDAPHAEIWDKMTLKEYGEKTIYTRETREMLREFINVNVTSGAYEASFLWFLWYLKQCGGVKRIFSTSNGGQERKFLGGAQQISEKIAARLGERVLLSKPVIAIDQSDGSVTVTTLDGSVYQADYLVLAIPPALHMKIHFKPELPAIRNQFIQRVPMGSVIKVHIYYKRTFWREQGMCGSTIIAGGDDHPVSFTLDDTKPDGSAPAIIGFILADKARRLSSKTPEERKRLFAASLAKAFNNKEALNPVHYEEYNWMGEQYSGGCYTAMYPPGCLTQYGKIMREPVGKIFFAGTETATKWSGYIEGGISAGERAAREVLHELGRITADQIWREEPVTQDVPDYPFHDSFSERFTPSVGAFLRFVKLTTLISAIAAGAIILRKHVQ